MDGYLMAFVGMSAASLAWIAVSLSKIGRPTEEERNIVVHVDAPVIPPAPAPHIIVKLVPGEVEVHPSVHVPVIKTAVEIVRWPYDPLAPQTIGFREIGHPDVQMALDTHGLAVKWPSGDIDQGTQTSESD